MSEKSPKPTQEDLDARAARAEAWGVTDAEAGVFADSATEAYLDHRYGTDKDNPLDRSLNDPTHEAFRAYPEDEANAGAMYEDYSLKDLTWAAKNSYDNGDLSSLDSIRGAIVNKLDQLEKDGQLSKDGSINRLEQIDQGLGGILFGSGVEVDSDANADKGSDAAPADEEKQPASLKTNERGVPLPGQARGSEAAPVVPQKQPEEEPSEAGAQRRAELDAAQKERDEKRTTMAKNMAQRAMGEMPGGAVANQEEATDRYEKAKIDAAAAAHEAMDDIEKEEADSDNSQPEQQKQPKEAEDKQVTKEVDGWFTRLKKRFSGDRKPSQKTFKRLRRAFINYKMQWSYSQEQKADRARGKYAEEAANARRKEQEQDS